MIDKIGALPMHPNELGAKLEEPLRPGPADEASKGGGFGTALSIDFSEEALAILGGGHGDIGGYPGDDAPVLTRADERKLDKLFAEFDRILETNPDEPLSAEQERRLDALSREIEGILGIPDDPFNRLSAEEREKIEQLFARIDEILGTNAGERPTAEQQRELQALRAQVDRLLGLERPDPLAHLSGVERDRVEQLFAEADAILGQVDGRPNDDQRRQLDAIGRQIDKILGIRPDPMAQLTDSDREAVEALFAEVERILGTSPDEPLSEDQERQLAGVHQRIEGILFG